MNSIDENSKISSKIPEFNKPKQVNGYCYKKLKTGDLLKMRKIFDYEDVIIEWINCGRFF
jgi:hypothetical protein